MSQEPSVLVVAGEASGDQHAAGLIEALNRKLPGLRWFGSGGGRMACLGVELLADVVDLAAIGPRAALTNLGNYWSLYRAIMRRVLSVPPRLAVLVDFPDFNLFLARRLKELGIPVCYFISPQIWAWREGRVEKVRRYIDLMLVILPFEEEFYRRRGVPSFYVGNPTRRSLEKLGEARAARRAEGVLRVGLLPGSRVREVEQIFPILLSAARHAALSWRGDQQLRFRVVVAPTISESRLREVGERWLAAEGSSLDLEFISAGPGRDLADLDCALVKSGTSTLEAMLLGVPFAMVYRMSSLSWLMARFLVRTDTYCLANIVAGYRMVEEFVQGDATGERIGEHLLHLLRDESARARLRRRLGEAVRRLGRADAYQEAAERVAQFINLKEEEAA